MPTFHVKNVNSVKNILYDGLIMSIGCLFTYFLRKITLIIPIFCHENGNSLTNTLLPCPYFETTSISLNHNALMSFFFKFFMINPIFSCPYLVKKISILSNLHIMTKKVNRMSFFRIFHEKKLL